MVRKDNDAHIVYDRKSATWGCVFYSAGDIAAPRPVGEDATPFVIESVNQPCLAMIGKGEDGAVMLRLVNPDLNVSGINWLEWYHAIENSPVPLQVTIKGRWAVSDAYNESVRRILTGDASTTLDLTCRFGQTYAFVLSQP